MDFSLLDNHVLVLVADVRQVAAGKVPGLDAMRQQHARRGVAQEKVLLNKKRLC